MIYFHPDEGVKIAWRCVRGDFWLDLINPNEDLSSPTHWMPLPKPPHVYENKKTIEQITQIIREKLIFDGLSIATGFTYDNAEEVAKAIIEIIPKRSP